MIVRLAMDIPNILNILHPELSCIFNIKRLILVSILTRIENYSISRIRGWKYRVRVKSARKMRIVSVVWKFSMILQAVWLYLPTCASFDILPLFAKLLAREKLSGAHSGPVSFRSTSWRNSERAGTARLVQFIPGLLCVETVNSTPDQKRECNFLVFKRATTALAIDVTSGRRHIFNKQCARPETARTSSIVSVSEANRINRFIFSRSCNFHVQVLPRD